MRSENQRDYFRLKLPFDWKLRAVIDGIPFQVLEIAERSIVIAGVGVPGPFDIVSGTLLWSDGQRSQFAGEVGPVRHGQQLIVNVEGILTAQILNEQRRVLACFPILKSDAIGNRKGE